MKIQCTIVLFFTMILATAQSEYEPSEGNPYGLKNPNAPQQLDDFKPFIGLCDCDSERRNQEGGWAEPVKMTWKYKYIMNGMAIQDETIKADNAHSGSIRQFNIDSLKWYVHYYSSSSATPTLSSWQGVKNEDGKIILYKPQKNPSGTAGFSRLTFYDISKTGYKWVGEWVNTSETKTYAFWKISCIKKEE